MKKGSLEPHHTGNELAYRSRRSRAEDYLAVPTFL